MTPKRNGLLMAQETVAKTSQSENERNHYGTESEENAREAFLRLLPDTQRGPVCDLFLRVGPRAGLTLPQEIVQAVLTSLGQTTKFVGVLEIVQAHPAEAEAFAAWAVQYHNLPPAERMARKQARDAEHAAQWQEQHPPTEQQLRYLRALGYTGPEPANRREASEQIDRLRRGGQR